MVGLFPVDDTLISWYRARATTAAMFNTSLKERINHERIDELVKDKLVADPGASYAKELYMYGIFFYNEALPLVMSHKHCYKGKIQKKSRKKKKHNT